MSGINIAVSKWKEILGEENVSLDEKALERAKTATFFTSQRVVVVIRPGCTDEVSRCVRVASEFRIPLYPSSGSRNWGYGSAVPWEDASALVDLRRMNAIVAYDERLGTMTVEPGVSFQQAYDFLEEKGSDRAVTVIGGTPHGSVLGNTLERGIGTGPYGERALYACDLEVVLADGGIVRTGLGRYDNARAATLARWGTGPSLDGLFFQSNLGIVTRMTVYLPRKPGHFGAFRMALRDEGSFGDMIDRLQEMRSSRLLESNVTITSDIRAFATYGQYPWDRTGGVTPLPEALRRDMRHEQGIGAWNVTAGLFAFDDASLSSLQRRVRRALGPLAESLVFVNRRVDRYRALLRPIWRWRWGIDIDRYLEASYRRSVFRGIPNPASMNQAYWRKRMPIPADLNPDRDRCGCIWISPELPFCGADAERVRSILSIRFAEYGFEPLISFVGASEHTLRTVSGIVFDRDVPGEDKRARRCYREMVRDLELSGYYSYRLGIQSMGHARSGPTTYDEILVRIKHALDPVGILSPGHYVPRETAPVARQQTRRLGPADMDAMRDLRHRVWLSEVGGDEAQVPNWLIGDAFDGAAAHWGVFSGSRLVAAARLSLVGSESEMAIREMFRDTPRGMAYPVGLLERMVVASEARKGGLSSRLVSLRVVEAARLGARTILLACAPSRIEAFLSLGFRVVSNTRDGFEGTVLAPPAIMSLNFAPGIRDTLDASTDLRSGNAT
jgi:4-cresol dehydrogenase (hydroxylating) flavoprotein subunit